MDNKKLLYIGGGALVLGAVAFFVWSFFKKPEIPLGETRLQIGDSDDDKPKTNVKNPFADASVDFKPISTPNVFGDIESLFKRN